MRKNVRVCVKCCPKTTKITVDIRSYARTSEMLCSQCGKIVGEIVRILEKKMG